ncbi:hypothetical protein ABVT39_013771 [Epinephelus coioides]
MCSSSMLPLRMFGLIMLMISLCDANSTCPTDLNPLTLEPGQGSGRISEGRCQVNCTSTEEYHNGMYWRVGHNVSEIEDDSFQYISWSVPLSRLECNNRVHNAPELIRQTERRFCESRSDNVALHCEAEGRPPPPVFRWTHDGTVISREHKYHQHHWSHQHNLQLRSEKLSGKHNEANPCSCDQNDHSSSPYLPLQPSPPLCHQHQKSWCNLEIPASINCSTSDDDMLGMGWEANLGGTGLEISSSVLWMVKKLEDWTIKPLCYITRKDNSQCSVSATITLYKTPDTVSLSALHQGPMMEGTENTLKCDILNVAPVQKLKLKWYRNNENVHTEMFSDTSITPVNVSSTLRVTAEREVTTEHSSDVRLSCTSGQTDQRSSPL